MGDDPVKASEYAVANLRRVIPNLPAWTAGPGKDDADLAELYGEAIGMWGLYMRHVASLIGGVYVDPRTATEVGAVYSPVPRERQERALAFLAENALRTPSWLAPVAITGRVGPSSLVEAQSRVLGTLLDADRLGRLSRSREITASAGYPVADYLGGLRRAVWSDRAPDDNLRALQRVYLDRLEALVNPPAPERGGNGEERREPPSPLVAPVNVSRSDLPALAREELRAIRATAQTSAAAAPAGVQRAHWADVAARVDAILDPRAR